MKVAAGIRSDVIGESADPRIVSLAPSATATLDALGAAASLVGVTTHCSIPAGRADTDDDPAVVGGWLNPDVDRVAALDPDLVCTSDPLQADVAADLRERGLAVHHGEPATLDDVVDGFADLAAAIGVPGAGRELVAAARRRLADVAERVPDDPDERPVVYCEEWSDPPMAAGNWVPDAVETAGGRYPFADPGERSVAVDYETVRRVDPDRVVLHVCGRGDRVDPGTVADRGWDLDAPVHVVDDSLLNQPSPALLDGVERLAELLHGAETDAP